jgi:oxidase EvaA
VREGVRTPTGRFHEWFAERGERTRHRVERVPFDRLTGWRFEERTGDLVHHSGKFFSVAGLRVRTDHREVPEWTQPIIVQPEIGILGILVKEFGGVLHCLMQAKMEPGNVNLVQLSPTVQATRSNYTRVHQGSATPYLEHFTGRRRGRVLVDVLQSEQGAWFLHKRNRNMVVEAAGEVPELPDFRWLTLGQIHELLHVDNLVNMDSRTVLSGIPYATPDIGDSGSALHDAATVLSWFTEAKSEHELHQHRLPLEAVHGWTKTPDRIHRPDDRYFSVIGVDVQAGNREVARWSQPMIAPAGRGLLAFVTKEIAGVRHLLVQARTEAGTLDVVEMAPTVHCTPANYRDAAPGHRPPYLDYVLGVPRRAIRHDVVHSEEGGRFYHAENRYLVVDAGDEVDLAAPPSYLWISTAQARDLVRHGNHFNVEARSLIAGLLPFG